MALAVALAASLLIHGWAFRLDWPLAVGNWVHPDNLSNHWLLVWVAERVLGGQSLLHNETYYWPVGDAPLLAGNGMAGFTYLPFHLLLGWPAGVLAWSLTALTWNGVAAAWLARAAGASRGGSWIAAALVASHPYFAAELDMGHFSQVDLGWWLAGLAALVKLLRGGPAWWGAVSGACAAAAALLYWYHGVFFAIVAAALIAALGWGRLPWKGLALAAAVGAALVAPWGAVSLAHLDQVVGMEEIVQFPHPHAVDASLRPGWPWAVSASWQWGRALPALVIPLALWGLRAGWTARAWAWLLVWGLGFLLAMGPSGPLYEPVYGLASPLRRFWWPYRHATLMIAAVATLAALGWSPRWPRWAALLFAASIPLQLRVPGDLRLIKLSPADVPPPAYVALGELPDGVVLEPPLAPAASASTTLILFQIWHRKPLLGGHALWVDRVRPDAWDEAMAASPFLSGLMAWELGELAGDELPTDDLPELLEQGVRYLVVNPEHFHRRLARCLKGYYALGRRLAGVPVIREGTIEIFDLTNYRPGEPVRAPANPWPRGFQRSGPEHPFPGTMIADEGVFHGGRDARDAGPVHMGDPRDGHPGPPEGPPDGADVPPGEHIGPSPGGAHPGPPPGGEHPGPPPR